VLREAGPSPLQALVIHSPWIYTMNRCAQLSLALALAGTLAALAPAPAAAQTVQRNFPQTALRGKIVFGTPPVITINGDVAHMATGYRIHGLNNLLVMSAQLVGSSFVIDYTTDLNGQVYEVWLLSAAEAAKKPWPRTKAEAAAWTFDPIAQTWTKP
jgi:hypothetical protein